MKSKLFTVLSVCAFVAGLVSSAMAIEPGYVSVQSSATKEVDPNRAEVTFYVETTKKTAKDASEENKIIANAVINAVKPEISKNESDSIKTSAFVVRPDYYVEKDNKRNLNGYVATHSIYIVTSNIQNVGRIIDLALSAGATKVDSLRLTLDNPNNYCSSVLVDAIKDSKFKAAEYAKALGTTITSVKEVNTSCSTQGISNSQYRLLSKSATAENDYSTPTPVEAGKIRVFANVNASYYLK